MLGLTLPMPRLASAGLDIFGIKREPPIQLTRLSSDGEVDLDGVLGAIHLDSALVDSQSKTSPARQLVVDLEFAGRVGASRSW